MKRSRDCAQCVQHAQDHAGNWLGLTRGERCEPCEDHAKNGCPGINRKPNR